MGGACLSWSGPTVTSLVWRLTALACTGSLLTLVRSYGNVLSLEPDCTSMYRVTAYVVRSYSKVLSLEAISTSMYRVPAYPWSGPTVRSLVLRLTALACTGSLLTLVRCYGNVLSLEADCTSMYRVPAYLGPVLQ